MASYREQLRQSDSDVFKAIAGKQTSGIIIRRAKPTDFPSILQLQNTNLVTNLAESERRDGFVTTPFDVVALTKLNKGTGAFVACVDNCVVGYGMTGTLQEFQHSALIVYMNSRLQQITFHGQPIDADAALQYGPVCIDKEFRGRGVLQSLFNVLCQQLHSDFKIGVTFISTLNPRSYQAHVRKLGMTVVDEFEFTGKNYYTLAFVLKK